jgi:hypothetical protein
MQPVTAIYRWIIEVTPEDENECVIAKRFTGTREQASTEGDRMADRADFAVAEILLHRRGIVPSLNNRGQTMAPHAPTQGDAS